jgi:hypothetical protein
MEIHGVISTYVNSVEPSRFLLVMFRIIIYYFVFEYHSHSSDGTRSLALGLIVVNLAVKETGLRYSVESSVYGVGDAAGLHGFLL